MKKQTEFDIVPNKENITYGFDKKHLTIIEKLDNGKKVRYSNKFKGNID